jgi:4-hydroxybenzoate polyprenyltransferase
MRYDIDPQRRYNMKSKAPKANEGNQAHPSSNAIAGHRTHLLEYIKIARIDHWVKNVFVFPGILVAMSIDRSVISEALLLNALIAFASISLIASSNYVINEVLDAPSDRMHPTKRFRPVPSGKINLFWAYFEWILLMIAGISLSFFVSLPFVLTMAALWVMGCIYNIPPIRTKDIPYLDVLSEAINNPLRMLAGWYLTLTILLPPASLLISYWMVGCYFMAAKRFAEYSDIGDAETSAAYRKSFQYYTEPRLLVSIMFYGSFAMLFFGAFLMRYRMELILSFPFIALVMAVYLSLAFKHESAAQNPEKLYRETHLILSIIVCGAAMVLLLFIDIPFLHQFFVPSIPSK